MITLLDYPIAFWTSATAAVIFIEITKAGFGGGVAILPNPYSKDIQQAIDILQDAGCTAIFLFGSLSTG